MSDQARHAMTVEAFLAWQTRQDRLYEFVDGQPVAMAGAKLRHDRVTGNAFAEIRRQLRAAGSPCDAFTSDIGIRTAAARIRRPEVSVLCPPFDEEAMTAERPRLIVEVLSEYTEQVDPRVKLEEYKTLGSLQYCVLIQPASIEVEFWFRQADGTWCNELLLDPNRHVAMPELGLSIAVAAFYERVPLKPKAVRYTR